MPAGEISGLPLNSTLRGQRSHIEPFPQSKFRMLRSLPAEPDHQAATRRIGLFVPCYIDQLYPDVALATVELLAQQGITVEFPEQQTCCGQPMANTGCTTDAGRLAEHFFETFRPFDYVVCPSGSCTAMVRHHYQAFAAGRADFVRLMERTFELCEFLVDVLEVGSIAGEFPYRVGLHQSCHGLRELRLGPCSEVMAPGKDRFRMLLSSLRGIELVQLERADECCGFGGTFAVTEDAVSCMMGRDRIADHQTSGTEVLTAGDMSCLMHLDGLIRRDGTPLRVMHIAQILAGRQPVSLTKVGRR